MSQIQSILFSHQDEKYGDFLAKLVPTLPREKFIGIRSPEYKKIMKELKDVPDTEIEQFLNTLPHQYHEENALHSSLIQQYKDFDKLIERLEAFLPYVDNWAISDSINPKVFQKNHDKLIPLFKKWIASDLLYTKRVGLSVIKDHFLGEDFKAEYLELAACVRSDEYYVNMMTAWLFADALVKQWDTAIEFFKTPHLAPWTHNKAIQKARESFRITDEQKAYLKTLKVKA